MKGKGTEILWGRRTLKSSSIFQESSRHRTELPNKISFPSSTILFHTVTTDNLISSHLTFPPLKGGFTCLFYNPSQGEYSQLATMSIPIIQAGKSDAMTSYKACSNIPVLLQTFIFIPFHFTFLTVASIRTSTTGLGFTTLR